MQKSNEDVGFDEKASEVPEPGATESKYPPYVRGLKPGSHTSPLKHINMYTRHFTKENIERAKDYLKSQGEGVVPIFMSFESNGAFSVENEKLYWQANDGSTSRLQVVDRDSVDNIIEKVWYQQDTPSGIASLHKYLQQTYLGIAYGHVRAFVVKQKPWQMLKPLRGKQKARQSVVAVRPFQMIEIDIGDMISFGQTNQREDPRFLMVMVDVFSGFCMAEVQVLKDAPTTLNSFKKMIKAVETLGYSVKVLKSDKGSEFQSPDWTRFNKKMDWKRIFTRDYPAVHVERKIRTLKRYISLNSIMTRGPGTFWFNVVNSSVTATNRIFNNDRKATPESIIKMDLVKRKEVHQNIKNAKKRQQSNLAYVPKRNEPNIGDSVRLRIPGEKVGPEYKSHLPYNKNGHPTKWTDDLHRIEKKRVTNRGIVKVFVDNRWRFWPAEVLLTAPGTVESAVYGQDGNVDYIPPVKGKSRPTRRTRAGANKNFDDLYKDPPKLKRKKRK
jgi:hypothetical protein